MYGFTSAVPDDKTSEKGQEHREGGGEGGKVKRKKAGGAEAFDETEEEELGRRWVCSVRGLELLAYEALSY